MNSNNLVYTARKFKITERSDFFLSSIHNVYANGKLVKNVNDNLKYTAFNDYRMNNYSKVLI